MPTICGRHLRHLATRRHTLEIFHKHLNNPVPTMEFTTETEKNGVISFLKIKVENTTTVSKHQYAESSLTQES